MPRGSIRRKPSRGEDAWEVQAPAGSDPLTGKRLRPTRLVRGTREDAERALTALLAEIDEKPQATEGTIAHLLEEWWRLGKADWSPKTAHGYRSVIDHRLIPDLGTVRLRDLTTERLDRYYAELRSKGLEPSTVRNHHAVLRRALRMAARWKWIPLSPAEGVELPKLRRKQTEAPAPTDLRRIVEDIEKRNPELAVALRLDADIGARRGELVALRWRDLDWRRGKLRIHRAMAQVGAELIEKGTKTHQERTVTLSPSVLTRLELHRVAMEARAEAGGVELAPDAFIFARSLDGTVSWRPDSVTQAFIRVRDRLKVRARLHDVRHFMATQWLADGVDPVTVAARLGHQQVSTTLNIYGHVVEGKDAEAAARMDGLLD